MPMRRRDHVGRTQISLSWVRSLLRNLLRWRSLPLTREKFFVGATLRPVIASQREKFLSETVQNVSIHAMVAGNERTAAL